MEIRMLGEPELLPALHLVWDVFAGEIAPTYSPEGVESFRNFIRYEYISQVWKRGNLLFFGAYDNGELVGTLAFRPDGHIALFFVKRERQGQGIGRMLFDSVYNYCAANLRVDRLTVNAAPQSVEKYVHLGMRAVSGEQERDGIRSIPMEMYVNMGIVNPAKQKSKAPWIALGVFGVIFLAFLFVIFAGVVNHSVIGGRNRRDWNYHTPYEDDTDGYDDGFWDEYGDNLPGEAGDADSGEDAMSGIGAIPEMIDDNLPYEIEDDEYVFSDSEKQSMIIEFSVTYPKISGLPDSKTEKKVNEILKAHAMETVGRIYDDPDPKIKERVLGEQQPMLVNYVEYKVCYATRDLISVVYDDYAYEGGQSYYTQHLRTCNISLKDGKAYEVKDIIRLDDEFLDEWLETMREETGDDTFLSELDQDTIKKALEGDSQDGVYVVNFFLDADGIEIGFDFNYEEDASDNHGYVWVTAPFTFDEIEEYATDSDFWKYVRK